METLRCSACKTPWHPASGHYISEASRWCGPCTRDFVAFLKSHGARRWGGVRFYDVATAPTGDTSADDLALDK